MSDRGSQPALEEQPARAPPAASPSDRASRALPEALRQAEAFYRRGDWTSAERSCRSLLNSDAGLFDALHLLGIIAAQTGRAEEAADLLSRAVAARPASAAAQLNYANALQALGRLEVALDTYERALKLKPDFAEAYNNLSNAQRELKRFEAALESSERALQLKPDFAEAYVSRGLAQQGLKRPDAALESYERALELKPDLPAAYLNRGVALFALERFEAALQSYERALQLRPGSAEAYMNCGNAQRELKRPEAALESFDRALGLNPGFAEAYMNRGNVQRELKRFEAALESYQRALQLKPDFAEARVNVGVTHFELKRFEPALDSFEYALSIDPDIDWLYGILLHTRMLLCAWQGFDDHVAELTSRIDQAKRAAPAFAVVTTIDSLSLQRRAAETYARALFPECDELPPIGKRTRRPRIRVGYYSSEFDEHATAHLAAELFERHDRDRFEVIAFSFGPNTCCDMRARLLAAFDEFVDVRTKSDKEVAQTSRDLGIDIAVDLKGFTQDARPGIFAHRAAPIQVGYLGYPGTTGAPYMDYIIADHKLIPDGSRRGYSEKIAYLPNSYQANDRRRPIARHAPSREALGLPTTGFVWCCFNSTYKITPALFDLWMQLLRRTGGSVLWLLSDSEAATRNLRREAQARGVDAARLIFAPRLPLPDHLARHRTADLFLDTFPCNAHTTASDALWAGLPVLTRMGESFATRVAASLLNSIGLPELITTTPEQYEALAIELASHPARLDDIRRKLHGNRSTAPLFDTPLFTRHIEDAYLQMYERYQSGLEADHIRVAH
jgi:predicted O-linked N-acetylglucosamine transferase (SPINDLY family)